MTLANQNMARTDISIEDVDLTTPTVAPKYPMGSTVTTINKNNGGVSKHKKWMYVRAGGTLVADTPYIIDFTNAEVSTKVGVTGAGRLAIPATAFTDNYYGFIQIEGECSCAVINETVAVADHLQLLNTGTAVVVDGSTGSTVELVTSCAVATAASSDTGTSSIYLIGSKADIAAS